jgi:hypothetical protein
MREQSLRTPWRDLAEACEQLIAWRSFALWVRAIVDAERSVPQWLQEAIEHRCPGFPESRPDAADGDVIWLDLSAWIEERFFGAARDGGWIGALHYYSGRDPRSEQIWNHWARTETAWRDRRPESYPTFGQWHEEALRNDPPHAGTQLDPAAGSLTPSTPPPDRLFALASQYIEWEAFAFWVRLMVERAPELPPGVSAVIEKRFPGFLSQLHSQRTQNIEYSTWFWRELLSWIENHVFSDAKEKPWLDAVRDAARAHLRGERIAEYWAVCSSQWRERPPASIPGFEQWLPDADAFVVAKHSQRAKSH